MTALRYDRVTFGYAPERTALTDVSLSVHAGERVALVGANGAGKTTLLLLATGLITPTSGRIEVEDIPVTSRTVREVRRRLAFVFADPDDQLFCPTVIDEVAFAPRQRGEPETQCLQRARALLAAVGLDGYEQREPLALSLGEKKRLAIATALATEARIFLLDEPTAGLDPRARRRLLDLLSRLEGTVVVATHDLDAAIALGTRVILMDQGTVAADGPADVILRDQSLLERHGL